MLLIKGTGLIPCGMEIASRIQNALNILGLCKDVITGWQIFELELILQHHASVSPIIIDERSHEFRKLS